MRREHENVMHVFLEWKMVEENNTFALGMLKERGRVAPLVYIKFVILGIYYFFLL
jgi:hypothetical protein